ncbi:MAG: site-specific DNA-methyltransferase [Halobacteria archaeon]|nr:site-specific DNA-methyltransferase [Halobacteria archaeon]
MLDAKNKRAPRNRTIELSESDRERLRPRLITESKNINHSIARQVTMCGDYSNMIPDFPSGFIDLLILDPPYNLNKSFNGRKFNRQSVEDYSCYLDEIISNLNPLLKETASVYICGDWHTSASIFEVASRHFTIRNRITWEREKGRGAKANWKNSSEDIWFCTVSEDYTFNVEAVKLRRRVLAPYTDENVKPKDWEVTGNGNFRDTHPSNIWTDITIPFWSMPENTDHPTQKCEKLIARLILASSNPGDVVLDPFLGSGTTSVVAKKLGRQYLGIDMDEEYCLLAERRLELADEDKSVQGFFDGVFWERNTLKDQTKKNIKDL